MKTTDEIFAKSEQLWPDFGSTRDFNMSLGFEEGAAWMNEQEEVPTRGTVTTEAVKRYEYDPRDEIDAMIAVQRRQGFVLGASWAVDGMLD